jgi:hypothetical protein
MSKADTLVGRQIAVIDSGWVMMADSVEAGENFYELKNASVILTWGTTKGLGEIAVSGPTPKTVLAYVGDARVNKSKILFFIPVIY